MATTTITRKVFLNSTEASFLTTSTGFWVMSTPLVYPPQSLVEVQLRQAWFYNTATVIDSTNNQLHTSLGTVTIATSSPSGTALATSLTSAIGSNTTVTFDAATLSFTFAREAGLTIYANSSALAPLGFSTKSHTGTSITSDTLCDLAPPPAVVFTSNLLTQNIDNQQVGSSKLAQVPLTGSGYGDLVSYTDTSNIFSQVSQTTIDYIRLSMIAADTGDVIDLQGAPWGCVLVLRITPPAVPQNVVLYDTRVAKASAEGRP